MFGVVCQKLPEMAGHPVKPCQRQIVDLGVQYCNFAMSHISNQQHPVPTQADRHHQDVKLVQSCLRVICIGAQLAWCDPSGHICICVLVWNG